MPVALSRVRYVPVLQKYMTEAITADGRDHTPDKCSNVKILSSVPHKISFCNLRCCLLLHKSGLVFMASPKGIMSRFIDSNWWLK